MKRLILSLSVFLIAASTFAQVSKTEKQALTDFYNATNGDHWENSWDLTKPVKDWEGVTVKDNKVTAIRLLFNNVTGEIPASIKNLTNLKELELSFNNISGELPSELGYLENLELLAFNGNNLVGEIPQSLGNLKMLKQLHLSSNELSGTIPSTFDNLIEIEVFNVFDNQLSGELPSQLITNRNLKEFIVAENNFDSSKELSITLLSNAMFSKSRSVIAIETNDDEN